MKDVNNILFTIAFEECSAVEASNTGTEVKQIFLVLRTYIHILRGA